MSGSRFAVAVGLAFTCLLVALGSLPAHAIVSIPSNFDGFGTVVSGYQDFFTDPVLNPAWQVYGQSAFSPTGDGWLHVTGATGDPNHLLYMPGIDYSASAQNVLALVRIADFGTDDAARGGVAAGVETDVNQGINVHFRASGMNGVAGNHFGLLDDGPFWGNSTPGPSDWALSTSPTSNLYWMRLIYDSSSANGDMTAHIWAADGSTPESAALVITDSEANHGQTNRVGYAGITASSNGGVLDMYVGYALIQANGLDQTIVGDALIWTGAGGAMDWDYATANWSRGGAAANFTDGSPVVFDDSTWNQGTITVRNSGSPVRPSGVTVNTAGSYEFIGDPIGDANGVATRLTKTGTGTLTLSSANSYSGGTVINAGILNIGSDAALGAAPASAATNLTFGGSGTLQFGAAATLNANRGVRITNRAVATIDTQTNNVGINGAVSGAGGLAKVGSGTLTLRGVSTYLGSTAVSDGALQLAGGASLPASTILTLGDANFFTSGRLVLGDAAGAVNQTLGGLLTAGTWDNRVVGGNGAAVSVLTLNIAAGTSALDCFLGGAGPNENNLALIKTGVGALTVSQANTYTGGTTINAGTLQISSNDHLGGSSGPVTFGGGTLRTVNNGVTSGRNVTINASGGTIDTNGMDSTWSGQISGSGRLTKTGAGTLTLSSTNNKTSFTGPTTIASGAIWYASGGAMGATLSSVTVGSGTSAVIGYPIDQATANRIASASTGTLALAASSSNPLDFGSSGANLPTIALGAMGTVTYSGALTLNSGGVYRLGGGGGALVYSGPIGPSPSDANHSVNILASTVYFTGTNKTYSGTTTLSGGTLRFDNGSLSSNASSKIDFAGGVLQWADGNTQDVSGSIGSIKSGQVALLDTGPNNVSFNTGLGGPGGLTKLGSGNLTLNQANTYSGTTRIAAGTLTIANLSAIATSLVDLNADDSGTLTFSPALTAATLGGLQGSRDMNLGNAKVSINSQTSTTYTGNLTGGATPISLIKSGISTSTLTLGGNNSYVGVTQIAAGTLRIMVPNPGDPTNVIPDTSAVSVAAGTYFDATGAVETIGPLGGAGYVVLGSPSTVLTVNSTLASTSFSGVISGTGNLVKSNSGTMELKGANTFSGAVQLAAGTLKISNALALQNATLDLRAGDTGTLTSTADFKVAALQGDRDLALPAFTMSIGNNNASSTYVNVLSGSGASLNKIGTGVASLLGANAYTGATTITDGTLDVGAGSGLPADSRLVFKGTGTQTPGLAANGAFSRTIGTAAGNVEWQGNGGFAAKGGPLSIQLGPTSAVWGAGGFVPTGSTLVLGSTIADDVVDFQSGVDLGTANRTVTVLENQAVTTDSAVISGRITGASGGGLTKTGLGVLTLSGANDYKGGTTISAGLLSVASDGDLGDPAGSVTINNGATLQITGTGFTTSARGVILGGAATVDVADSSAGPILNGALSGAGSLTKAGAGTLVLAGAGTYAGNTTVSAGTLQVDGSLDARSSPVTVNSAGILSGAGAIHRPVNLAGLATVHSAATLTLGGALNIAGTGNTLPSGIVSVAGPTAVTAGADVTIAATFNTTGTLNTAGNTVFDASGTANIATLNVTAGETTVNNAQTAVTNLAVTGSGLVTTGANLLTIKRQADFGLLQITTDSAAFKLGGSLRASASPSILQLSGGNITVQNAMQSAYRYYAFEVDSRRGGGNNMIQFSEFSIFDSAGNRIVPVTAWDPFNPNTPNEGPTQAIDDNLTTKLLDWGSDNGRTGTWPARVLIVDFGTPVSAATYNWATGNDSNVYLDRDPVTWKVAACNDATVDTNNGTWVTLDDRSASAYAVPQTSMVWVTTGTTTPSPGLGLLNGVDLTATSILVDSSTTLAFSGSGARSMGGLTMQAGTLTLAGDEPVTVNRIVATGASAIDGVPITLGGQVSVDPQGAVLTIASDLPGNVLLTKSGPGTLVLSGNNSYTGATEVYEGTLKVAAVDSLPAGQSLTIGENGTVVLSSGLSAASFGASRAAMPVPEPPSLALLAAITVSLLACSRRRRN